MIRRLASSDIQEASKIWLEGNLEAHSFIDEEYFLSNLKMVKAKMKEAEMYGFFEGGVLCGFIGVDANSGDKGGYVEGLFVKKEFRKKGIGRALIDHVARRYHPVELEVYEKNKTALKFYLDLSFSEVERSIGESTKEVQLRLRLEKCL